MSLHFGSSHLPSLCQAGAMFNPGTVDFCSLHVVPAVWSRRGFIGGAAVWAVLTSSTGSLFSLRALGVSADWDLLSTEAEKMQNTRREGRRDERTERWMQRQRQRQSWVNRYRADWHHCLHMKSVWNGSCDQCWLRQPVSGVFPVISDLNCLF